MPESFPIRSPHSMGSGRLVGVVMSLLIACMTGFICAVKLEDRGDRGDHQKTLENCYKVSSTP